MNLQPSIQEIRKELVKLPLEQRLRLNKLITKNMGKEAEVTIRPKDPVTDIQTLSDDHRILVDVGYIKNIVILKEDE